MAAPYDKVLAVTGSLGSGKSTAAKILAEEGATVISADDLAREAVIKGSPVLEQIAAEFGEAAISPSGELDRKYLGRLVFADPAKRRKLEFLLHPIIAEKAKERFLAALAEGKSFVVYDCPLFFEAGLEGLGFRDVIFIDASPEHCLARVLARDGLSKTEAEQRLRSQLPPEKKRSRARTIIQNDGTVEELRLKLRALLPKKN